MPIIRSEYGLIDPLRLTEEIAIWKARERENASSIRSALPGLEPVYASWLGEWENVFDQTREYAQRLNKQLAEPAADAEDDRNALSPELLEE